MDILRDFFDTYERNARLYPALIILSPLFVALICLFPELRDLLSTIIGSIFFVGISYLLGKLAREIGKKKQTKLISKWDGMPSTRFLRHRDTTIDLHTKKRYHQYLGNFVVKINIPTPQEELEDPEGADLVYESTVKWLLNKTRDTSKYSLLFRENISYGFARNFWAMKPWGILINLIVLSGTIAFIYKRYSFNLELIPSHIWFGITWNAIVICFILFFTETIVHSKAKAYARTLLEVCDE